MSSSAARQAAGAVAGAATKVGWTEPIRIGPSEAEFKPLCAIEVNGANKAKWCKELGFYLREGDRLFVYLNRDYADRGDRP